MVVTLQLHLYGRLKLGAAGGSIFLVEQLLCTVEERSRMTEKKSLRYKECLRGQSIQFFTWIKFIIFFWGQEIRMM